MSLRRHAIFDGRADRRIPAAAAHHGPAGLRLTAVSTIAHPTPHEVGTGWGWGGDGGWGRCKLMQTKRKKLSGVGRCRRVVKMPSQKMMQSETEDGCCTLTAHIVCQNSLRFACRLCSKPASADSERIRLLGFEHGGTGSGWLPEAPANFNRVLQDRFWFPSGCVEVRSSSIVVCLRANNCPA